MTSKLDSLRALHDAVKAGTRPWREPRDPDDHPHDAHILLAFSGSLDAAHALHKAVLPGWAWEGGTLSNSATVYAPNYPGEDFEAPCYSGEDPDPARALLLAILAALVAQEERGA